MIWGPGRKPGASLCTRKRLSLTGTRAKAWCLLTHAEASLSLSHGVQGESLVPPHARGSVSLSLCYEPIDGGSPPRAHLPQNAKVLAASYHANTYYGAARLMF